jgi:hypothetical protein
MRPSQRSFGPYLSTCRQPSRTGRIRLYLESLQGFWWTREDRLTGRTRSNIDRAVRWMHDDRGLSHRSVVLTLGIVKQVLDSKSRCASALYSAPPSPPTVDLQLPCLEHGHESEAE